MALKLPPLPILAGAVAGAGYALGHAFSGAGGGAPAAPTSSDTGAPTAPDALAGLGGATLDFGDGSSGAGTLNGVIPGATPVGSGDLGGVDSGGDLQGNGAGPPVPPPSSTPPPSSRPAALGARPSSAAGWVQASGIPIFSVAGGVAKQAMHGNVVAWVGASAHYKPNATLRKILTGGHAGLYVHVSDVTLHTT